MDLERFVSAQSGSYQQALSEIRSGHKQSHWMWYIFPQIAGLGHSTMAQYYAIPDLEGAKAYYQHPVLGERLVEISSALLQLETGNPTQVMGYPDDIKLRSSMTLFMLAVPEQPVFKEVLEHFYHGEMDERTIRIVNET